MSFRLPAILLLALPLAGHAGEITLRNGDLINGAVTSLDKTGILVLETRNSPEPLRLKASSLKEILFPAAKPAKPVGKATEFILLANGDSFPATLLAIQEDHLRVRLPGIGEFSIPRAAMDSIDFGNTLPKLLYSGPLPLGDWKKNRGWKAGKNSLISHSHGSATLENILLRNFRIDFTLSWIRGQSPNLRLLFCAQKTGSSSSKSHYYLSANAAGFSLVQKSSGRVRRHRTLSSLNYKSSDFPKRKVRVSIRLSREKKLLLLFLNDRLESRVRNLGNIPGHRNLILESLAGGGYISNQISGLRIYEWNQPSHSGKTPKRPNIRADAFRDKKNSLYTGRITSFSRAGSILLFKHVHSPDLLRIPSAELSSLHFRQQEKPGQAPLTAFSVHLRHGGKLHINAPVITKNSLRGLHPVLKKISIPKSAITRLARRIPGPGR